MCSSDLGRWRGPLHGVPLAFKDLCHVRGLPTSCGTRTAEYFFAEEDCTAVARLVAAGKLDYRQTVASIWPEFAAAGKEAVTIEPVGAIARPIWQTDSIRTQPIIKP